MTDDKNRQLSEIRSDIETTRQRLAQTLDEIEDRLDVPKQVRRMIRDARERFDALRQEQPVAVYGSIAGAAVLVVGGITAAIVGAARGRSDA